MMLTIALFIYIITTMVLLYIIKNQHSKLIRNKEEIIEAAFDIISNGRNEDETYDSLCSSTNCHYINLLVKYKKLTIIEEYGRRIIAKLTENR